MSAKHNRATSFQAERSTPRVGSVTSLALASLLMVAATSAQASENRVQRYTPGLAGSDLTSMLVPGWYGQVALVHYHATKLKDDNGNPYAFKSAPSSQASFKVGRFRAEAYVALPRITYISSQRLWGGHLGFTAMLPMIQRATSLSNAEPNNPAFASFVPGINTLLGSKTGSHYGIGDLEIAPVINWSIGDNQTVTLAPTLVLPTGSYDASRPVNVGFGRYYTFRPSIQYGYIGDGWDFGARALLSFNSRNKATGYRSGSIFNLDFALMKFVSEDVRLGLQGYVVKQFTNDSSTNTVDGSQTQIQIAGGNKLQAYALGPALGWLQNGGEMLVEGKVLREFDARNRSEGTTYMLTISKPFGM